MSEAVDDVLSEVRERVTPGDEERTALERAATTVVDRATAAVADLPVDATVVRVGSTARNTWVAGDRDVDVFVCFPPELTREQLEEYGLAVGHETLPEGHEEYAEHPYVVGTVDGYQVDVVPCFAVEEASEARTAVDRTPFHTRYVADRLDDDLAAAVRVCKQFGKATGVYGSDLRTRGFSGYLTELLVLEHGGVEALLEAAADWEPPVRLDPENHGTAEQFDGPLVVVDPTDPERNVAAVVTDESVARFQHYARQFLATPSTDWFDAPSTEPYDPADVAAAVDRRGTTPVAVTFDRPDAVDDQLWPQLDRSLSGVADGLDRHGFDVLRSRALADDERCVLLFELAVAERPAVERHVGPPLSVREHATGFYERYADDEAVTGPFLDGDRYVVERERDFRTAEAFLASDAVHDVALGTQVAARLDEGYDVLTGERVAALADRFGAALADYFDPRP